MIPGHLERLEQDLKELEIELERLRKRSTTEAVDRMSKKIAYLRETISKIRELKHE